MNCYLTLGLTIKQVGKIDWLAKNSHRVVSLRVLKYLNSDSGKLMALLRDGSMFHAPFFSHRSMIAWAFHPQFEGMPFGVFGYFERDPFAEWDALQLDAEHWISAGSPEHWKLLSDLMKK